MNTGFSRKEDEKSKCFPIDTQVNRHQETRMNLATQEQGRAARRKQFSSSPLTEDSPLHQSCEPVSKKAEPGLGLVLAARHKLEE